MRPLLEYCSPTWSPHHRYLIDKLEKVQKYFTKRIPGLWRVPYIVRLRILNLKSLEDRRTIYDLTTCFQLLNGHLISEMTNLLVRVDNPRTRGHDCRLIPCRYLRDVTKFSFINRTIKVWNRLPNDVATSSSVTMFKRRLSVFDIYSLCT